MDAIKTISEVARTLLESDAKYDQDICKMTILFPLLETLGYDATKAGDIILNPAYINSGEYKIDYGLRGTEEDSIKTMVKMIELDAEPGLEFSNIRKCIMPTDHVEYIIITDCFNYFVYANADGGITFLDVVSFNITNINAAQQRSFNVLANPNTAGRQDYAIHDDEPVEESAPPKSIDKYIKTNTNPAPKTSKHSKQHDKAGNNIGLYALVGAMCVVIILSGWLFGVVSKNNINNWHKVIFSFDETSLNYYTLKGNVNASAYTDRLDVLRVQITQTNLPPNTNVTLNLKNEAGLALKINVITNADGCIDYDVPIPTNWKNTNISVTANVFFDTYQTNEAKEKFGDVGQYLIGLTDNKNVIGSDSTYYDYDGIAALIKEREEQAAAEELRKLKEYFSQFKVVQYSNGDICFYPKGYDNNDWDSANDNITSTNKSYAKIYYNATTKTGTFYYVVGTFMKSASWPAGTFILSDTVNTYEFSTKTGRFKYHINKYDSITGWCLFDQTGINSLVAILQQVYSSNAATIEFKDLHKVSISPADKTAVLSMIDLYTKYFSNGSINLNPEWFTN